MYLYFSFSSHMHGIAGVGYPPIHPIFRRIVMIDSSSLAHIASLDIPQLRPFPIAVIAVTLLYTERL
ncbi:hypothetical protein Hypma_016440 [Hypsizygus marmoreus]|uniref:Uncharacterized protein n=1 Tax=Hypsizygus marmoreus TaxID=39966 RepID=A0A369J2A6_HYPMA|nr:hypothetical protein Hypma_016440 [Hypsizygus marmoreus]